MSGSGNYSIRPWRTFIGLKVVQLDYFTANLQFMKISLSEIWNFIGMIDQEEKGWSYSLHAGTVAVENIHHATLLALKEDEGYDTELLPSIFTFREILWQPDVFTDTAMSLPGLRILKAFCEETVALLREQESDVQLIYAQLIEGLSAASHSAVEALESESIPVTKALRDLRKASFPIIKFFTFHPKNRLDYHQDAVNRLNYAVKIMLTQFHGRYTELQDPYWQVNYAQPVPNSVSTEEH